MISPIVFFKRVLLSIVSLVVIDASLGAWLGGGYSPGEGALHRYFSYGVSTQAKLLSQVGVGDAVAAPIALAGWNSNLPKRLPAKQVSCEKKITVYGMSFANRLANQAAKLNPCVSLRLIAGPGAPLSHSYSMYQKYGHGDDAEIVVLGVLASALPKINTVAHFNSAFEAPGTHMYPRYKLVDGALVGAIPLAVSLDGFRELLRDNPDSLKAYMAENDDYYSQWIFGHGWADASLTLRMARRALGQKHKRSITSKFYTKKNGYSNYKQQRIVANALLAQFTADVLEQGKRPVILLFNDRGYDFALDDLVAGVDLERALVISSSEVIDSSDNASFEADGHFKAALDRQFATLFLSAITSSDEGVF